ncbi:hypothetical protein GCM10017559_52830 [Streptosporangium longisporum]|uniref:Uncharacterized protein n=1 Tax=Streptosporangium longisporum TaxID=46187 RepID=A0ABP6KUH4_9ACTN
MHTALELACWFTSGNTTGRPVGTVQVRRTVPPKVPARNHTSSGWFRPQNLPVVSATGFVLSLSEAAQVHQRPWIVSADEATGVGEVIVLAPSAPLF